MNFGATGSIAYTSLSARFRSLLGMCVAYIMFTVRKMGIDPSRISQSNTTFKGVIPGVEARCRGSLVLEVTFGSPDNFRSEELLFDIAPFSSDYHALLGRTTFALFNTVPNYAYLKL